MIDTCRVPCQSRAQSISSSQSVLFVCWVCFGTCRPLIDMGARAGKTFLCCEANNGPSVTLPQMFGLGCGGILYNSAIEIWIFFFCSYSYSLYLISTSFIHHSCSFVFLFSKFSANWYSNLSTVGLHQHRLNLLSFHIWQSLPSETDSQLYCTLIHKCMKLPPFWIWVEMWWWWWQLKPLKRLFRNGRI